MVGIQTMIQTQDFLSDVTTGGYINSYGQRQAVNYELEIVKLYILNGICVNDTAIYNAVTFLYFQKHNSV